MNPVAATSFDNCNGTWLLCSCSHDICQRCCRSLAVNSLQPNVLQQHYLLWRVANSAFSSCKFVVRSLINHFYFKKLSFTHNQMQPNNNNILSNAEAKRKFILAKQIKALETFNFQASSQINVPATLQSDSNQNSQLQTHTQTDQDSNQTLNTVATDTAIQQRSQVSQQQPM